MKNNSPMQAKNDTLRIIPLKSLKGKLFRLTFICCRLYANRPTDVNTRAVANSVNIAGVSILSITTLKIISFFGS
jgi:hypothetical protein